MEKRLLFISDMHGCADEFIELLDKAGYDKSKDRLIFCGDAIDRGPKSVECIRLLREMGIESIRGNHDDKFLKWLDNGKQPTRHAHYHDFNEEDIEYIRSLPLYIKVKEDLWAIHAGVRKGLPIEKQKKDDLLYLRYVDKLGKFISVHKVLTGQVTNPHFWTEFGSFGASVVYGHNVHSLENIQVDKFEDGTACYGIDTGCAFGGHLSCLAWDTKEVFQVKAKMPYYTSSIKPMAK